MLQIHSDADDPVRAELATTIDAVSQLPAVVLQSAGDSRDGQPSRNPGYDLGLLLVLNRLRGKGLRLHDAQVASAKAQELPLEERRVVLSDQTYPTSVDDPERLRAALKSAMARTARRPGAKGAGNSQKALMLVVECKLSPEELGRTLAKPSDLMEPTANTALLERRVDALRGRRQATPPEGARSPKRVEQTVIAIERSPAVKSHVLDQAAGRCEACDLAAPFVKDNGEPYLEVHHVVTLADGGPDTIDNSAALCPTCHRALHYASDREERRRALWAKVDRLVQPEPAR